MSTITAQAKGGWGRDAFAAAKANAARIGYDDRRVKSMSGVPSGSSGSSGCSQAELLEAILRELPVWANRSMAVPHLMKHIKTMSDRGVRLGEYDIEEFPKTSRTMRAALIVTLKGPDADGTHQHLMIDLAQVYGVVQHEDPGLAQLAATGSIASQPTIADVAGAGGTRGNAEMLVGGACDATGGIPGVEAGVPGAAAPASASKQLDGDGVYRRAGTSSTSGGEG